MDRSRYPWLIVGTHHPLYCSRLPGSDCRTDADNIRNGVPIEGPALTTSREHDGPARGERESWGEGIRDGTGLERLFYENGVDLFLSGHVHNYERHFDIAPSPEPQHEWTDGVTTRRTIDPPATTYIVTGAAGNVERHVRFLRHQFVPAPLSHSHPQLSSRSEIFSKLLRVAVVWRGSS